MTAYYNEIDPYAAQWLRNLISKNLIAPGDVDERSITDVHPDDVKNYTQCHFFAGIGGWSYAARLAGWPDDRRLWTGSCPCQPFSDAGKGGGFADERHLWPHFHHLIEQCRPPVVAGEQVASKDGLTWLDLVQADMEGTSYAFGAVDICAAGVGAPHIRQRLYWIGERLADADDERLEGRQQPECERAIECATGSSGLAGELADAERIGREVAVFNPAGERSSIGERKAGQPGVHDTSGNSGPTNGLWRDADWLFCRDGKWRPVEPGTFPVAHGLSARVGRLRAYGNAIVPQVAAEVIRAYLDR